MGLISGISLHGFEAGAAAFLSLLYLTPLQQRSATEALFERLWPLGSACWSPWQSHVDFGNLSAPKQCGTHHYPKSDKGDWYKTQSEHRAIGVLKPAP
jgi:hypothetical protein